MKKIWENHRQFVNGSAAFFGAMVLMGSVSMFIFPPTTRAQVAEFSPFVGFGATVISIAVPLVPNPACPYYYLVQNDDVNIENPFPQFGLFIIPGSEIDLYDFHNLAIPGTALLGGIIPVPNVACGTTPTGGPVFPIFFDGLFFLTGSGAGPSF